MPGQGKTPCRLHPAAKRITQANGKRRQVRYVDEVGQLDDYQGGRGPNFIVTYLWA